MLNIGKRISRELERMMATVISNPLYTTLPLPQLIILARATYTKIIRDDD